MKNIKIKNRGSRAGSAAGTRCCAYLQQKGGNGHTGPRMRADEHDGAFQFSMHIVMQLMSS